LAGAECLVEFGSDLEETEGVGDGDAAATDFLGDLFLGEVELGLELGVALGFFEGVEVFALEILDEGEFEDFAVGGGPFDDGDVGEAGEAGGAPTPFAGDQFENVAYGPDDEGLDDSLFADGICQFTQGFVGEVAAGLEGAGSDLIEWDPADSRGNGGARIRPGDGHG
jgi:hypothetical protein